MSSKLYEEPWKVDSTSEWELYHTTDVPGIGVVEGQWDLRNGVDGYLGGYDFSGKRVLEIGPASGFLTFHMERTAREVVAVDLPLDRGFWDFVPYAKMGFDQRDENERSPIEESFFTHIKKIRNGFWLCYDRLGSKAKVFYGPSDALPKSLGKFDVALLAAILVHAKSPAAILESCARLVTDTIIVTDLYDPALGDSPTCLLVPSAENDSYHTWWRFTPAFFTQYLGVLGFKDSQVTLHKQRAFNQELDMFTVVARRSD